MKTTPDNQPFLEWVEQYVNDTITPTDAEQLLEIVQNDPEKLDILCAQLQTDRLLEIMSKHDRMSSIAEVVMKKAQGVSSSADIKRVRRSRLFLKVAASAVILLGLGTLLLPKQAGRTFEAQKIDRIGESATTSEELVQEVQPSRMFKPNKSSSDSESLFGSSAGGVDDLFADSLSVATAPEQKKKWEASPSSTVVEAKLASDPLPAATPAPIVAGAPVALMKQPALEDSISMGRSAGKDGYATSPAPVDSFGLNESLYYDARGQDREVYARIVENDFKQTADKTLSTFSIDVDTASYANIRRFLKQGQLPPADAVRLEEMINYFTYDYEAPAGEDPFSTAMALTSCPWNKNHQLLRVGLQGQQIDERERKPSNLVFLLDVSGSMNSPDKLPLLKNGFEKMVRALGEKDRVAIVVYAGSSGVVLDSTSAMDKETIIGAMSRLKAGGSTAGGAGIELAYKLAADHYIKDGVNRVILATDGDFNVGISNQDGLQKLIEDKRKSGVFLSVLGFGTGNLQDAKMETLANKGNGNYFYIDSEREAEKVLVKQLNANLVTIAKDVKIQVEFNPAVVRSYRLIGYENRLLAARDFDDDTKDAGEIGAGHQVTALYEIIPVGAPAAEDGVELKYTQPEQPNTQAAASSEMLTLKLRYKQPEGSKSKLLTFTLDKDAYRPDAMDESFRWATAIAAFGMHLRESPQISTFPMDEVIQLANGAKGEDELGYRKEAIELMNRANGLKTGTDNPNDYPQWQYR